MARFVYSMAETPDSGTINLLIQVGRWPNKYNYQAFILSPSCYKCNKSRKEYFLRSYTFSLTDQHFKITCGHMSQLQLSKCFV